MVVGTRTLLAATAIHADGKPASAELTDDHFRIAAIVRPKLVQDGMLLVGLDIMGDKLMEIHVFSPSGLGCAQKFVKVNFTHGLIQALERKAEDSRYYQKNFDNVNLATM